MAACAARQPHVPPGTVSRTEVLQTALGHRFANPDYLARALTHSSASRRNYERLEFLGDRVLGLVIAEWLSELHPAADEGTLAKSLAAVVARDSLAFVARSLDLGSHLTLSIADAASGGRDNPGTLADCCEAVIASLYLDGGLDVARRFIREHWAPLLASPPESGDAKTRLQEWTQARGLGLPAYNVVDRDGPDHAPSFTVEVTVRGHAAQSASGASKRLGERAAAEVMLRTLEDKK